MKTRVTLDKAGRMTIPQQLRKELSLDPGNALEIKCADGRITLRPAHGTTPLTQEHGVLGCFTPVSPCPPPPRMRRFSSNGRNATWLTSA
jgi:AbrB family looped-hinge helix DNA binding protein